RLLGDPGAALRAGDLAPRVAGRLSSARRERVGAGDHRAKRAAASGAWARRPPLPGAARQGARARAETGTFPRPSRSRPPHHADLVALPGPEPASTRRRLAARAGAARHAVDQEREALLEAARDVGCLVLGGGRPSPAGSSKGGGLASGAGLSSA